MEISEMNLQRIKSNLHKRQPVTHIFHPPPHTHIHREKEFVIFLKSSIPFSSAANAALPAAITCYVQRLSL